MILRSVLVSRTKPTASNATPAENAQSTGESTSDFPPHRALGGFALATAAPVASTPTSSSGVGRLGDGGRGATKRRGEAVCSRRASQSSSELDAVSAAQGASEAGAEGAEGPEASTGGGEPTEAAWRARETRERRSWGGGTGGQHLVAKPVTSPDSARATEPRKPEAVLELRRGARLGSGAGERERVRAREEADVRVAERNKDAATSWLPPRALRWLGAEGEPAAGGAAERPDPAGPMTLERPSAMESSSAAAPRAELQADAAHHHET